MPTPVKNAFPAPAPAKPAAAAAPEGMSGERFQNELVRRRRGESTEKPQAARKAEARRAPKAKRSPKADPGGPPAPVEDAEVRAEPGPGAEAAPAEETERTHEPSPEPADTVEAGEDVDSEAASEGHCSVGPVAASPALAEAAPVDPATEEVRDSVESPIKSAARPVAYPAIEGAQEDETGEPAGGAAGAEGSIPGDFAALLADTSSETGGHDAAPEGGRRPAATPAPGAAGALDVETLPELRADAPGSDPAARAPGDATSLATSATAALADAKPEARPAAAPPLAPPAAPALPPEARFAAANHENIVTSMRAEVLPNGGSIRLRLDPPQLGALQVTVQIRDGWITAAFETTSDEATRLLGHSLNQLKSVLESHGVAVDKLQVQQAPREAQTQTANDGQRRGQGGQSQEQEQSARQEQQRREMLQRMWRRLAGGQDPLDLTA